MKKIYNQMFIQLFKSRKWISLLFLLIIPVFYVFFYVGAYDNIINNTKNFRVGVVVEDLSYHNNNFGTTLKENLKKNKDVKFEFFKTKEQANVALKKYDNIYEYISIPKNFTQTIVNIKEKFTPSDLNIELVQNPKKNGFSDTMTQLLKGKLKQQLNETFIKTLVNETLSKSTDAKEKLLQMSSGVVELKDGYKLLNSNLKSARKLLNEKQKIFNKIKNNFYHSVFYKELPDLKNDLNTINLFVSNFANKDELLLENNVDKFGSLINKFANNLNLDQNLKDELLNNFANLSDLHNEFVRLTNSKNLDTHNLNTKLEQLNTKLESDKLLLNLNDVIKNSKILSDGEKDKLINLNDNILNFKQLFIQIIRNLQNVINSSNKTVLDLSNYVSVDPLSKLFKLLNLNDNLIDKISSLVDKNKISSIQKNLNLDTKQIVQESNITLDKMQKIEDTLKLIFGNLDLVKLSKNPLQSVNSLLHPVTIQRIDLNDKPKFGAIFLPLTLAIGLWFVLIFYFTGSQEKRSYQENFMAKYFFNLTISQIIATLCSLIMLLVMWYYQIKITNILMFILLCNLFVFSIFNLFTLFYNYIFDYAKYILTIFLIINITCSGSTYVINTLHPNFALFNNFTHFKYFINSLRELISSDPNYSIIWANFAILIMISLICALTNFTIKFAQNNKTIKKVEI